MTQTKEGLEHYGYKVLHIGKLYYVSWLVNGKQERIEENGQYKWFRVPEQAHKFCEKHARMQQANKSTSENV